MTQWQPIATVPDDGTWVLCWSPGFLTPAVGAYEQVPGGPYGEKHWKVPGIWFARGAGPTHWMPLPDPPSGET